LCDNKGPTVTIIKVQGTGKLIGGYSPVSWHSQNRVESGNRSFLFSLGDQDETEFVLSESVTGNGVYCYRNFGPSFGDGYDLILDGLNFQSNSNSYCFKSKSYSQGLLD